MKLLGDRVRVLPIEGESITKGGIIIPDKVREKTYRAIVLEVGPGTKDEPMELKPEDKVMYGKYSGNEINWEGQDTLIMRQSDIFATYKDKEL